MEENGFRDVLHDFFDKNTFANEVTNEKVYLGTRFAYEQKIDCHVSVFFLILG